MAVEWPNDGSGNYTIPYLVQQDKFSFKPSSGMIRDDVDAGYPLVRRRFTATIERYSIALVMTYEELIIFKEFFQNSPGHPDLPGVQYGGSTVYFPEPLWSPSGAQTEADRPDTSEFRWVVEKGSNPYTVSPDGDTRSFIVSFELEKLP